MATIPSEIRAEARANRVDLDELRAEYAGLRELARQEREWLWDLRKRVWSLYAWTPKCRPFWQHGLHRKFAKAFAEGDRTNIPRWDDVAQSMAEECPELRGVEDPAERLFELLREPHEKMPPTAETWALALDRCRPQEYADVVPF